MQIPEGRSSPCTTRLCWREGVAVGPAADGTCSVQRGPLRLTLSELSAPLRAALGSLDPPGGDEAGTADVLVEQGGAPELMRWYYTLQRLARRALIERSLHDPTTRLATLEPTGPGFTLLPPASTPRRGTVRLCRFAYLRRLGRVLVVESPRAHARVRFDAPEAVALLGALSSGVCLDDPPPEVGPLAADSVAGLLNMLADAGMLTACASPSGPDDELPAWEFHDLLFHARSRRGRSDAPFGATFRPDAALGPPPAVRPDEAGSDPPVSLEAPDMARLAREDPTLASVMEARRSIRSYGERPLNLRQLGEFLYRVARLRGTRAIELQTPRGALTVELASRPFPSGGALYELDFYLAVQRCEGLEAGLYAYDPRGHRLRSLNCPERDRAALLRDAAASADIDVQTLQVLLILSARFPRLTWKYASIAYALILKHVGVVFQTMYLAATAMRLAPCALGGGDSDLFARAAGLDYYAETSVGEFLLGSLPPHDD